MNASATPPEASELERENASSGFSPWWFGPLLFLLALLAYLPAIQSGFIWDDDDYVTENANLTSAAGLVDTWIEPTSIPQYYPLVHTTFWLEYQAWGLAPMGYHVTNVLLHALAALLLTLVLVRLEVRGAALAGIVFALHPVHVESVAWITERKNVLSAVFYLAAMLAYFRFAPPVASGGTLASGGSANGRGRMLVLALVFFAAALLSKSVACTLPAALLVIRWWKLGVLRWRDVVPLVPMFLLGVVSGLVTIHLEKTHVAAVGAEWDFTLIERCLIAGRAVWFYAAKLLWPAPLVFIYPRWEIDSGSLAQALFPLAALLLLAGLWFGRRRLGRGPLAAVLLFGGTLLPALGFFDVYPMLYSFVADHFQYLASASLLALFATLAVGSVKRALPAFRQAEALLAAGVALVLVPLTYAQCGDYKDLETLWRRTITKNPGAWMAHNNLGTLLGQRGELEPARASLERAIELAPDYGPARSNLGNVCMAAGDDQGAREHYLKALELDPGLPGIAYNIGQLALRGGDVVTAQEFFVRTLELDSAHAEAAHSLGLLAARTGDTPRAREFFERAVASNPSSYGSHLNLGRTHLRMGAAERARGSFSQAQRLRPDSPGAAFSLGEAFEALGRKNDALEQYRRTLSLAPDDAAARERIRALEGD